MATGEITTLPATPEDGGSGGFLPGNFKEPKRLYCKNGGYFLRINSNGSVDGIRDKNDPHNKLQLQATSVGEVVIKGVSANRYLAMNADGRLFGATRQWMHTGRHIPDMAPSLMWSIIQDLLLHILSGWGKVTMWC
ncbi:fibroblast growth factor 2-like isoform X2 [Oncorhynchus keta]|uniref:fibroblast growth factor 2-like isoform X2 n=1 Tax=Oncorhynchus keta TaxID=8018 RepID=UPI0015FA67B1|nr:fibroblast growth factor 2-like isoform X2 [Oncorhynchus keta]